MGRDVSVYSSVCLFVSRCSRKEACEKWAEPLHFSTELKQCVDITVTPDNMSVTSASTQVIEFYMLLLCSAGTIFIMHCYYGHSQRHPLLVLLLQYNECFDKNILYENEYHKMEMI